MSKVVAIMSMSLDGYVADLNDGVAEVFDWYFTSGDVEIHTGGSDPMTFKVSEPSAEHIRDLTSGLGAVLTGRRTFDVAQGWGGNHAWGPAFVLTHHIPAGWPRPDSTVHFVTDGIESAVKQAKNAAGGKSVGVHGADTIQQCLNAGLLDEIQLDLAAVRSRLRSSTLRPRRRHARLPWQPHGDPGRRRHTPALPGTQGGSRSATGSLSSFEEVTDRPSYLPKS
jgi:dihydrofolate reductase